MLRDDICIDAHGGRHPKALPGARIVSLVPSLTELLCDLGLSSQLVGRTGFCIHPRDVVRQIPKVGGTKDVDLECIREIAPSHVILNIDENTRDTADALAGFVDNLVVTHPQKPDDNLGLFEDFGFIFSCEQAAKSLTERFRTAKQNLPAKGASQACDVLYLIWRDPWMTVTPNTYISQMLQLIGWQSVVQDATQRYPIVELKNFVGKIQRVLLSSEPYPFREKHIEEVRAVFGATVEVELIDGEMLSWYGSRSIPSLEYLAALAAKSLCGSAV